MLSTAADEFLLANRGKTIVFTNGCFDILHAGHVSYLEEAKSLGDVLIVGLNSDDSVKRLKGDKRPINTQDDRKSVLEALRSVDLVEVFEDDTPYSLIERVSPNVLVKGGDWAPEDIVGHDFVRSQGGEVLSLSFKRGISSTKIIEKINQA